MAHPKIMFLFPGVHSQLTAVGQRVAPSGHQTVLISHGAARGQGHGLDVAVEGGGPAQLDQHDVVVQVVAVVLGVLDQLGSIDPLLGALVHSNVVLTKTHLHTTGEGMPVSESHCVLTAFS